eukprot:7007154-Alexandrium_andersonii.AAC.1
MRVGAQPVSAFVSCSVAVSASAPATVSAIASLSAFLAACACQFVFHARARLWDKSTCKQERARHAAQ